MNRKNPIWVYTILDYNYTIEKLEDPNRRITEETLFIWLPAVKIYLTEAFIPWRWTMHLLWGSPKRYPLTLSKPDLSTSCLSKTEV